MYANASHGSNPNLRSAMDTPTRPSSSLGRNPQQVITSLKPHRSFTHDRSNSSSTLPKPSTQPTQRRPFGQAAPSSWGLQGQIPTEDLANLDLSIERSLGYSEVQTDGSERARRTLEEEMRRGLAQLREEGGAPDESVGFGDLSDAETDNGYGQAYNRAREEERYKPRIEDESDNGSNGSGAAREMADRINNARPSTYRQELDAQSRGPQVSSDDDLTFISIARTVSPQQTYKPAPAPQPAASSPFVSANPNSNAVVSAGLTRATLASFATRPNENKAPLTSSPAFAARPVQPASYKPSPLSAHFRASPSLGTNPIASSLPRGPTGRAAPAAAKAGGVSFATKVNAWNKETREETEESEVDQSRRMRLPDVTGLTEGLRSPIKARGHASVAKSAATASTEGALLSSALGSMRAKLAQLERENAQSDARVRELEAKLARDQANQARASPVRPAAPSPKQAALESEVHQLRQHVQHLSQNLAAQSSTLASLQQPSPTHHATTAQVSQLRAGLDHLSTEVDGVKTVVEGLLSERDERVRVGEWEREEGARREAVERRRREEEVEEDGDRTPRAGVKVKRGDAGLGRTWASAPVEQTVFGCTLGRSFLGEDEIERMREMIASPTPRGRRTLHNEHPARPASAPSHSQPLRHSAPTQSHRHRSERDSSSASSVSSASSISSAAPSVPRGRSRKHAAPAPAPVQEADYSTDPTEADTEFDEEEAEVEKSFRRARDIFRSVSAPVEGHGEGARKGSGVCELCNRRLDKEPKADQPRSAPAKLSGQDRHAAKDGERRTHRDPAAKEKEHRSTRTRKEVAREDPHVALAKVLGDLEADFNTHKKLYLELSEQYRRMDAKAGGGRRRALAEHLKESIDTLEGKADQVRKLHKLLHPKPSLRRA